MNHEPVLPSLYDDFSKQQFLEHLGTETPGPVERYRFFTKLWHSWENNSIPLELNQVNTVQKQIAKWDLKQSWDYQIRYSNKPGVDRELRLRDPEYTMFMLLILKGGES